MPDEVLCGWSKLSFTCRIDISYQHRSLRMTPGFGCWSMRWLSLSIWFCAGKQTQFWRSGLQDQGSWFWLCKDLVTSFEANDANYCFTYRLKMITLWWEHMLSASHSVQTCGAGHFFSDRFRRNWGSCWQTCCVAMTQGSGVFFTLNEAVCRDCEESRTYWIRQGFNTVRFAFNWPRCSKKMMWHPTDYPFPSSSSDRVGLEVSGTLHFHFICIHYMVEVQKS